MDNDTKINEMNTIILEESCEEGIILKEPPGNEYPKIEKSSLDKFPYFLIGQIKTYFNIPHTPKTQKQGVGILIGPNIVLTAAHILCQKILIEKKEKTIFNANEVSFSPASSENFNAFNKIIISDNFIINDKYIDLLREKDLINHDIVDEKYRNDWALIFLPYNLGDKLIKLFDIDNNTCEKLKIKNGVFQFFHDSIDDLDKYEDLLPKQISLLAYIENNYDNISESFDLTSENEKDYFDLIERPSVGNTCYINDYSIPFSEAKVHSTAQYNNSNIRIDSSKNFQKGSKIQKNKKNDFVLFKANFNGFNQYNELKRKSVISNNHHLCPTNTMCETKGFLYNPNKEIIDDNFLFYQFNTLKGQSGAPLFLRLNSNKGENNVHYYFLGLHIRRGPSSTTLFSVLTDFQYGVESKVLNHKTIRKNRNKSEEKSIYSNFKNKISVNTNISASERKIRKENGECEYNVGLKINNSVLNNIITMINNNFSRRNSFNQLNRVNSFTELNKNNSQSFINIIGENNFFSNYIMIKLYFNNSQKLKGLFHRCSELLTLFQLSGKLLKLKKKFITLDLRSSDDIKYRTYHKQIFDFDKEKRLYEVTCHNSNLTNSFCINNSDNSLTFDIGLNLSLLSDFHSERILNKVAQNNTIDINLLKQFPIKFSKNLTVAIFSEIEKYNNLYPDYGEIFQILQMRLGIKKLIN